MAHRDTRDQRKADRLKAVYLLGKGWSAVQVSEALLVDDDTVRNWFKRYCEQGQEGLVQWQVGGSQGYLSAEQQALLRLHLEDQLYSSSAGVGAYLQRHTQVCYKPRGSFLGSRICEIVDSRPGTIYEIAEKVGYESEHAFSLAFKKQIVTTPKRYRDQSH